MLNRMRLLAATLAFGLHFASTQAVLADSATGTTSVPKSAPPFMSLRSNDWSWTDGPWDGDDRPFAEARRNIDALIASKKDVDGAIERYSADAQANPGSAIDQFKWAYADYMWSKVAYTDPGKYDELRHFDSLCAVVNQKPCYNFVRMIFLVSAVFPEERRLAERLLAIDPNDTLVKCGYAELLSLSEVPADQEKAINIAQGIVGSGSCVPRCYLVLGFVYSGPVPKSEEPEYYHKAMIEYDKFLSLSKPDDPSRGFVFRIEAAMKRRLSTL